MRYGSKSYLLIFCYGRSPPVKGYRAATWIAVTIPCRALGRPIRLLWIFFRPMAASDSCLVLTTEKKIDSMITQVATGHQEPATTNFIQIVLWRRMLPLLYPALPPSSCALKSPGAGLRSPYLALLSSHIRDVRSYGNRDLPSSSRR
jgi:hypothetical protein